MKYTFVPLILFNLFICFISLFINSKVVNYLKNGREFRNIVGKYGNININTRILPEINTLNT